MNTTAKKPPMKPSDEATKEQLDLAIAQGDALKKAIKEMLQEEAHGKTKKAGNYVVGYAVEKAEGMYHLQDGELVWQDPTEENAHVEIVVCDGADGRFIPELDVTVTLTDAEGKEIGTHRQPFIWHPWLYHYGLNWTLPSDGKYTIHVTIAPPAFMRHDKKNGKRFAEAVEVEFADVKISTGKK